MAFRSAAAALCVLVVSGPALADDNVTTFHYMDLYNIQHSVAGLGDLKALRVDVYVTSALPGVRPQDVILTMQLPSGAKEVLQRDDYGHTLLPESAELQRDNPLIVSNQPKHSLRASVLIDLAPLPSRDLAHLDYSYSELMLGVSQFNEAEARQGNAVSARIQGAKARGLLLFYNEGAYNVTLHRAKGPELIKGLTPRQAQPYMKELPARMLLPGTEVIFIPLDPALLAENPRVTLQAPPAQIFPAF
jgi:hypothetical protein